MPTTKGPTSPVSPSAPKAAEPTVQVEKNGSPSASAPASAVAVDSYQKQSKQTLLHKSSLIPGAQQLFTKSVEFPHDLLDTKDPQKNRAYQLLLAAILGWEELERSCFSEFEEELKEEAEKRKRLPKEGKKPSDEKEKDLI